MNFRSGSKFIIFFSFLVVSGVLFAINSYAVTDGSYTLVSPNGGNLTEGCVYAADIRVNTGSNNSNAADISIMYEPSKIDIIDSIPSRAGIQIEPGTAYESYYGNEVITSSGIIRITAASYNELFRGEDRFATIQFRAKADVTSTSFTIKFDGASESNTLDSNIAIAETSLDALGSVSNLNLNFVPGNCLDDNVAPNINFINPVNNQSGVPLNQNVEINLTDNLSGVDLSTLQILVNGVPYSASDPELQITGSPNNYTVIINPRDDFYSNAPSSIVVSVTDFNGNSRQSNISFNFPVQPTVPPTATPIPSPIPTSTSTPSPTSTPGITTQPNPTSTPQAPTQTPQPTSIVTIEPTTPGDTVPPIISFISPVSRETIGNNGPVVIMLQDNIGVDINSLQILINEKRYTINDFSVTVTGSPNEYVITIKDSFDFSEFSSSYMTVFVKDLAGNTSVNNIIFNIPKAALSSPEEFCEDLFGDPDTKPVKGAPFSDQINNIQKSLEDSLPASIKSILKQSGLLGLASLIAALPILLWIGSLLFSFLAGGLLFPFIVGLFSTNRKQYGITIDDVSKQKISLVKIEVYDTKTGQFVKNAVSNFNGRYYIDLPAGEYSLEFTKDGYESKKLELFLDKQTRLTNIVELNRLEVKNIATDLQFKTLKIDPKVMSLYFSLIFAFFNILYVRTILSVVILGLMILAAIFLPKRLKKK